MYSADSYNESIGSFYKKYPYFAQLSPTLCRCEGQSSSFLKFVGKKPITKNNYFSLVFIFFLKILRDIIYTLYAKKFDQKLFSNKKILVFSFFDSRSNNNGTLKEEYFREILENNANVVCIYKLITPKFLRGLNYINTLQNLKKNHYGVSEYSFFNLKIIFKSIFLSIKFFFVLQKIKSKIQLDTKLKKIILREVYREIFGGIIYQSYSSKLLYEKLLINKPILILSVWENQPWNRILESVKKVVSPHTLSRGFQHTGFSKKLLQHFPSKFEINLDSYPDEILCNGKINKDALEKFYPNIDVRIASALRQNNLNLNSLSKLQNLDKNKLKDIAFAFSWDENSYAKILKELEQVPKEINIYLKFHPNYPHWKDRSNFQSNFINCNLSWEALSKICPLVLVNDNSIMFESFFYGMHSIIYEDYDLADLEKRDFQSPILHIDKSHLKKINSLELIDLINISTKSVLESNYLIDYFNFLDIDSSRKIFLELNELK
tara:strand:- start:20571 stop:22043 length:1473 start_codon:yes stop_codon:yes gene_type:complete